FSKSLDLENYNEAFFSFYTRYYIEGGQYDFVEISFSNNDTNWEKVLKYPDTGSGEKIDSRQEPGNDLGWLFKSIPIPQEYLTSSLTIRIRFISDNGVNYFGAMIDDIILYGTKHGFSYSPAAVIQEITPDPALFGEEITFIGTGFDDGQIEDYSWSSSIDGLLSNKATFGRGGLSPGYHTILFKVQDNNGSWSEEVSSTILIHEKPTAVIDFVSPTVSPESQVVSFKGHGDDDGTITSWHWRSSLDGELSSAPAFSTSSLSGGEHTIFFEVQDNHRVWSDEVFTTLTVHQKPSATIISVSPNPALDTDTLLFKGKGTDDGTIERYVWRTDDKELYNSGETEFEYSNLTTGNHTIYLKVQDNYGVWSNEVNTTLIIHQKPVANITSISPNPALNNEIVHFVGSGTDDGTIVRYVWRTDEKEIYNGTDTQFNLSNLAVGNHTIFLKVQDNYDVWSDEVNTTLVVNEYIPPNKKPTVTITSPKNGAEVKGKVAIKGTASDEDGTVEKVQISINSGPWLPVKGTETWSIEWNTEEIDNGEYTIKVRSYDGTDYSEEQSVNIKVENKDDGGGGFIPGFEPGALIGALVIGLLLFYPPAHRSKKRSQNSLSSHRRSDGMD
ncbi:MAG: hypothetical protein KAU14_09155, partial [Thermoplasmata archaeon]|nr:hypothetical protein [Thermoplasmata archaeon]